MMTTIQVPDMHCEKCVERITKLLTEDGLAFTVSLTDKSVTVDGCDHCVKTAVEDLEDLGFTPSVQ
ncbi:MAG TPA: heavy metal-associated domain-containing protein [Lachnospiraceae bacterium]|nr:heavy metal-associated domain-containing protein [Lachnospiraceae bacterium]